MYSGIKLPTFRGDVPLHIGTFKMEVTGWYETRYISSNYQLLGVTPEDSHGRGNP